ncbi:NAD(P)H-dependent oxidoreductase [Ancylobacter sp. Lp-2]|uniref:NAD(P)H-dependent oxidoreductase n=1 Tax=Ancylobacter sp. Lp-2 TaxID=2881339 RepID=UPI001E43136B|nr:NAD(P)H-dependent oxidoreductase [Ancylobacter sp. Lp-2]MCB4771660.1 NAD(P)H-dependent oxidoreductase [Ancylobacter sp. Lp-2]
MSDALTGKNPTGKTLVLLFHPDPARSRANARLASAAARRPDVEVVDMAALYPHGIDMEADGAREAARLLAADRLVLQFPLLWYATPPLLKAWQDAVLTRMFYVAYESEGRLVEGMPLLLALTAGGPAEAYRSGAGNPFALDALLAPLRATAHRCGLALADPFIVYEANKVPVEALDAAAEAYARQLDDWITDNSATPHQFSVGVATGASHSAS